MKRVLPLLLAAAVAGLAWSASRPIPTPSPTGRWENATELRWLTRFGHWQRAFHADRISIDHCGSSLAARVGSPPTPRLMKGFRLAESSCGSPHTVLAFDTLHAAVHLLAVGQLKPLPATRGIPDVDAGSYLDPALTRIATAVAGKHVDALCWSPPDWRALAAEEGAVTAYPIEIDDLGWTTVGGSRVNLSPGTCKAFEQIVGYEDVELRRDPSYWGWAFTTVTHEAEHARGTDNEAETECYAIQQVAEATFDFGYTHATGRILARAVWAHYGSELPAYRSKRCRNGGPYDLNRDSSLWP